MAGGVRRLFTPFGITQVLLAIAVGAALWMAYTPWRWERFKDDLRTRFPEVRRIAPDGRESLSRWFSKRDHSQPILIDVRPQAEYDFSHLPGAKHMAISDTPRALGFPENSPESLVIYDAVGSDAFPVAAGLVNRGYQRVQILEGGIFEWANRGLPLEGAQGSTGTVRNTNPRIATFLKRRARE
jgi:rhodanese-related sulfurtransferase